MSECSSPSVHFPPGDAAVENDGDINDKTLVENHSPGVVQEIGNPVPRLVRRNLPFSQSRNRLQVEHNHGYKIFRLLRHDWFHVVLRLPTGRSLLCLLAIWTSALIVFAGLYVWVDTQVPEVYCGFGPAGSPIKYGPAFSFSLETCTTGTCREGVHASIYKFGPYFTRCRSLS